MKRTTWAVIGTSGNNFKNVCARARVLKERERELCCAVIPMSTNMLRRVEWDATHHDHVLACCWEGAGGRGESGKGRASGKPIASGDCLHRTECCIAIGRQSRRQRASAVLPDQAAGLNRRENSNPYDIVRFFDLASHIDVASKSIFPTTSMSHRKIDVERQP